MEGKGILWNGSAGCHVFSLSSSHLSSRRLLASSFEMMIAVSDGSGVAHSIHRMIGRFWIGKEEWEPRNICQVWTSSGFGYFSRCHVRSRLLAGGVRNQRRLLGDGPRRKFIIG